MLNVQKIAIANKYDKNKKMKFIKWVHKNIAKVADEIFMKKKVELNVNSRLNMKARSVFLWQIFILREKTQANKQNLVHLTNPWIKPLK